MQSKVTRTLFYEKISSPSRKPLCTQQALQEHYSHLWSKWNKIQWKLWHTGRICGQLRFALPATSNLPPFLFLPRHSCSWFWIHPCLHDNLTGYFLKFYWWLSKLTCGMRKVKQMCGSLPLQVYSLLLLRDSDWDYSTDQNFDSGCVFNQNVSWIKK